MASLPSPTQVAGSHYQIYEAYYQQIDPNNQGVIGAFEAARFLKKSKLSDIVLGKIWDLSDPNQKGSLNKQGFFVALKLCALAQSGRGISMDNITAADVPYPKMGEIPKIPPNKMVSTTQPKIDWSVKPAEKAKYDQLFDSLQPTNGVIPGNKVRNVLMDSKLPVEILGKIWDLADLDKDGSLSRHEFMIAMHLVYKALEKHTIPNTLPTELMPPGKRKDSLISQPNLIMTPTKPPVPPQPSIPPLPSIPPQPSRPPLPHQPAQAPQLPPQPLIMSQVSSGISGSPTPLLTSSSISWVVTAEEKAKADALFQQTDFDKDGFVSGFEIKDVFLQSGVPQPVLAHIWSLCDTHQTGKLNNEQFALAMWLINQKVKGFEPPVTLTPEMVPPCMRGSQGGGIEEPITVPTYSNPELELIATDIAQLTKERNILEADIAQKEADIKIRNGEVKNLQSEVETLAATLKQLENQKGEAQKRLNDLKAQKSSIELELSDLVKEVETEQLVVDKLKSQAAEQEESLRTQESELNSKKQELDNLKQEETRLEKQQEETKKTLDNLGKNLQESQLQISQVRSKITQLEEIQRQMNDAIAICETALTANDASAVPDSSLSIGPDFRDPEITKLTVIEQEVKDNTFSNRNGTDGFSNDTFPDDAFTSNNTGNAFGDDDVFNSAFQSSKKSDSDGFGDPFSATGATNNLGNNDPFDPFGDGKGRPAAKTVVDMSEKDPFGCDPFANLHAPERPNSHNPPARPESPSPALPPKKSKQPPPRPAPPRPMQPNMRAAPVPPTPSPDSTSANTAQDLFGNSGGFANFANFDSKCCHRSYSYFASPVPGDSLFSGPSFSESHISPPQTSGSGPELQLMNKSDPKPATRGLRPDSKSPSVTTSQSTSPVNTSAASVQGRYAAFEFTEDPFKNYRYDDLDNIDPFEEDAGLDKNKNISSDRDFFKFDDDLAYEMPIGGEKDSAFEVKFPKVDAFELSEFTFSGGNVATTKMDKLNGNAVGLFSNSDRGFSDKSFSNTNSDPFQLKRDDKNVSRKMAGTSRVEKLEDESNTSNGGDDDPFGMKKMPVDAKGVEGKSMPNEEMQLVWAAKESLRLEEERLKQEAQEKADYEYALALSKKDTNKDKKTIKNILRLGKNTPAA